jgi:hypothetical protein
MAKINEQTVLIHMSKLVRDDQPSVPFVEIDPELLSKLESIITKMVDDPSVVVEVKP